MKISFIYSDNLNWAKKAAMEIFASWAFQPLPLIQDGFKPESWLPAENPNDPAIPSAKMIPNMVEQISHNLIFDDDNMVIIEAQPSFTKEEREAGGWRIFENDSKEIGIELIAIITQ